MNLKVNVTFYRTNSEIPHFKLRVLLLTVVPLNKYKTQHLRALGIDKSQRHWKSYDLRKGENSGEIHI